MSYQQNRIFTLNEPNAPRLNPALAVEIGLNESLLLLQIEFFIAVAGIEKDGNLWIFNSTRDIQAKWFPFWSHNTINRALNSLETSGYINTTTQYNTLKYDKTRWFTLNYQGLAKLKSIVIKGHDTRSSQFDTGSSQNGTGSNQIDTTIQENLKRESKRNDVQEFASKPSLIESQNLLSSSFPSDSVRNSDTIDHHDLNDLLQSIPEIKRSDAVKKLIEKALINHSVNEIKNSIAYTVVNSKGSKQQFKAYFGKTLENRWSDGFESESDDKAKAFLESRKQLPDSILKHDAEQRDCKVSAQVLAERQKNKIQ